MMVLASRSGTGVVGPPGPPGPAVLLLLLRSSASVGGLWCEVSGREVEAYRQGGNHTASLRYALDPTTETLAKQDIGSAKHFYSALLRKGPHASFKKDRLALSTAAQPSAWAKHPYGWSEECSRSIVMTKYSLVEAFRLEGVH